MSATPAQLESWIREAAGALQAGRARDGRALLERVVAGGRGNIQVWMLLALACRQTGDAKALDHALDQALRHDPANLFALVWKGDSLAAANNDQGAISFYERAVRLSQGQDLPRDLAAEIGRASAAIQAATTRYGAHLENYLTAHGLPPANRSPRFQEAIGILAGEKQIFHQQPSAFYFPQLPQRQFYEREEFDWVAAVEAQTGAILAELEGLLETREEFRPYLVTPADRPRVEFHGLNDNPGWSTLYLWENGEAVTDHVARCPITFETIRAAPLCEIAPRAPTIMFSLLQARARIPAHTGVMNARLICHLPLIVPTGCGFRVGNEVREWEVGKLLIFDDTIEHEAWNESDEDRVVLIFDVWRPELTEEDRVAVKTVFDGIQAYGASRT